MTTIKIEIKNCMQCPFFKQERLYTADSFEQANDWLCLHPNHKIKKISGYVEWHEEKKVPIPDWCPAKA